MEERWSSEGREAQRAAWSRRSAFGHLAGLGDLLKSGVEEEQETQVSDRQSNVRRVERLTVLKARMASSFQARERDCGPALR